MMEKEQWNLGHPDFIAGLLIMRLGDYVEDELSIYPSDHDFVRLAASHEFIVQGGSQRSYL